MPAPRPDPAVAASLVAACILLGCAAEPSRPAGDTTAGAGPAGGTGAAPALAPVARPGDYLFTSDPPGAAVLIRDCPTCEDRLLCTTPCVGPDSESGLTGRYASVAREGYLPARPVAMDPDAPELHFDLIATSPAAGSGFAVTGAQRTARYRSALTGEPAAFEPLSADAEFLVVSAHIASPAEDLDGPAGADAQAAELLSSAEALLLGPDGHTRRPALSHRRQGRDGLDVEYAFSVPVGEAGPFRIRFAERTYPIAPTRGEAAAEATGGTATAGTRPALAPVTAETAAGAVGAHAAAGGRFKLCAAVERYALCGDRPCRADGLLSKSSLVCRDSACAGGEIPGADRWEFSSLTACVAACRGAQEGAAADGRQQSSPTYCMQ